MKVFQFQFNDRLPFACGCLAGFMLSALLFFVIPTLTKPSEREEQEKLERQKAALQMSIKALDAYYQMLTNAPKK